MRRLVLALLAVGLISRDVSAFRLAGLGFNGRKAEDLECSRKRNAEIAERQLVASQQNTLTFAGAIAFVGPFVGAGWACLARGFQIAGVASTAQRYCQGVAILSLVASVPCVFASDATTQTPIFERMHVDPPSLQLHGPDARFSLLVHGETRDGRLIDLTRSASYRSLAPDVARVSSFGHVRSLANGRTTVAVSAAGQTLVVPVLVEGSAESKRFHFENDIVPILSRFGCNSSSCHGKAEGQNGFKLSIFGFDPAADLDALVREGRGRRVFPAAPERSLLLQKSSGGVPHGGGIRILRESAEYRLLRDWIATGMTVGERSAPHVVSLRLTPRERQMNMKAQQQLRVMAVYSDGREVDVTSHAKFQSNNDALASVNEFGLVATEKTPGEAAVMARYMGQVDVFRALVAREDRMEAYSPLPVNNFIDQLVGLRLQKLNIAPSESAGDAEYLRRIYLDVVGTLPTADEARVFLSSRQPEKRARLVDTLLARPEFADYWAQKWADLLRVNRLILGRKHTYRYYRWIHDNIAQNKPYDQFVRELVTAEGSLQDAPAGTLYKVEANPGKIASTFSQVFLGVRIECAECHHHPFDRWGQTDYYGMQAFFTQLAFKPTPRGELLGPFEEKETKHPRTEQPIYAHALGTANPVVSTAGDRRKRLADWMVAPENPWFARNLVNRVWAHFLGRGLVEPVDDFRSTNPPTNPELLDRLARDFAEHGFDVKHLIRTITASQTYQLSSRPNATNELDEQNYSRALFKRLDAEVLFDAICQTTGVAEKFSGVPASSRAIQLWDSHVPHYFLRLFGRPERTTSCQCERSVEPSISQALHVLNSTEIHAKLSHAGGRIAALVERHRDDERLAEELYLMFYSRFPSSAELATVAAHLKDNAQRRREAAEDIAWCMMNTVEFLFNH